MRIPIVDKFLFCFRLETGGTTLGWIGSIIASVMFLITITMFGVALFSFPTFENITIDKTDDVHRERLEYSRYSN